MDYELQPKDIDWLNGYKNKTHGGFPGGAVVESPPADAGVPRSGKTPHAAERLGL